MAALSASAKRYNPHVMMVGQSISHYKLVEKLGEGGMGVVYKAEDTKLNRQVALKFLAQHLLDDEEAKERFLREAQAAASLDHPNICQVFSPLVGRSVPWHPLLHAVNSANRTCRYFEAGKAVDCGSQQGKMGSLASGACPNSSLQAPSKLDTCLSSRSLSSIAGGPWVLKT